MAENAPPSTQERVWQSLKRRLDLSQGNQWHYIFADALQASELKRRLSSDVQSFKNIPIPQDPSPSNDGGLSALITQIAGSGDVAEKYLLVDLSGTTKADEDLRAHALPRLNERRGQMEKSGKVYIFLFPATAVERVSSLAPDLWHAAYRFSLKVDSPGSPAKPTLSSQNRP